MFDFTGKKAYVAGGCGLIGKAIVNGFREVGAETFSVDLLPEAEIMRDMSDLDAVGHFFDEYKDIDVWVNAAYPPNFWDHLSCFLFSTTKAAENMERRGKGGGAIVNLSSIYGVVAPDYRAYCGTDMTIPTEYAGVKAGIIAMSRCLATKYARDGIRVNCVSPGGIFDKQPTPFFYNYIKRVPMNRMGHPKDIVGAVVFLASDEAGYITGQNLIVDGGLTCW